MQPTLSQPGKFSFNEIRALVYGQPSPRDRLPAYDGASFWETLLALFFSIVSDRIARSMKRTLADSGDLKDDQPKLFHPKGVCAEARWEVFAESGYTGLFAPGAGVPALVRMSASGNNTVFKSGFLSIPLLRQPRSFGLAVKLFPASDPDQKVRTCNLLLFDQTGVDGNPSPWYMRGARQENGTFAEQYFLNWMHGSGLITTGFARLFSRFATDVRHRSLNSLANIDAANRPVPIPKCPPFLRLVPVARYPVEERSTSWPDFRLEILDLAQLSPLAFDIVVSETNPVTSGTPRVEKSIGRLTLGSPVVSTVGDRQLHFTHRV